MHTHTVVGCTSDEGDRERERERERDLWEGLIGGGIEFFVVPW